MSWLADQIYAVPKPGVINAFLAQPGLRDELFLVKDLEGIQFDWARQIFFSDAAPMEHRAKRHGLPDEGLLVVSPVIYKSGYDRNDSDASPFWQLFNKDGEEEENVKWSMINGTDSIDVILPSDIEGLSPPLGLLRFLKALQQSTHSPLVYYYCQMWGGDVEVEVAWVFDHEDKVFRFIDDETIETTTLSGKSIGEGDVLQQAMRAVGLVLPTKYFALHTSFDWQRYWLGMNGSSFDFDK